MIPRPLGGKRLVILGTMGRSPFGGTTWQILNWLRAFSRLNHQVYYVEDDSVWPYHPTRNAISRDCSYAIEHIPRCLDRIGLSGRWAFRFTDSPGACWGMTERQLAELYRTCDALLNITGGTELRAEHLTAPLRIYVQTDPVTLELRLANGDAQARAAFASHHHIVTFGENYGAPDCGVPLNGLTYLKTRQPIDLDLWPVAYDPSARFFTTIGNYRQSGKDVEYRGETYRWSKHHEWERFIDLPRHTNQPFELSLRARTDDRRRLESNGWRVVSPLPMSLDIFGAYPDTIRKSRGAFTVAKDQNVRLRSGWFSDREACYLACGKPVVVQDTRFDCVLPTGQGLFAFTTMDQAVAAIAAVNADYARHCLAARAIAEEFFSAPKVGAALLRDVGLV